MHVAHEFCLLCCNVQKSPVYKAFSYFALKIIPDFCETCQVPFLKEWMRESKLQAVVEKVEEKKAKSVVERQPSARPKHVVLMKKNQVDESQLLGCIQVSLPKILRK